MSDIPSGEYEKRAAFQGVGVVSETATVGEEIRHSIDSGPALVKDEQYDRPRHYLLGGRNSSYRWWKPILAGLVGGLIWIAASNALGTIRFLYPPEEAAYILQLVHEGGNLFDHPIAYIVGLGTIALSILAVFVATSLIEKRKPGTLSSIAGRLRWHFLSRALIVALLCELPILILTFVYDTPAIDLRPMAAIIIIGLLLIPFQAAAEEYVFRGWAMQTLGGWGLPAWLVLIVPVIPFALAHIYSWIGMADVAIFGLCVAWLTLRTGGLEAAIALHIIHNLSAFGIAAVLGDNATSDDGSTWESLLFSVATMLIFTALTDWWLRQEIVKREGRHVMSGPLGAPVATASE